MNRLLIAIGFALFASAVGAQEAPAPAAPATSPQEAEAQAQATGHSKLVYHGPHHYPATTRGGPGDPPVIDHSMDTLVVEPTRSSITITTVSATIEP